MRLTLPFVCLFVVLTALLPTAGFYDLYLLPWQSRLIFVENPNLWHAMRHNGTADVLALLPAYFAGALVYGGGGITAGPAGAAVGVIRGPAVVEQQFVAVWRDLAAVDIGLAGAPATTVATLALWRAA